MIYLSSGSNLLLHMTSDESVTEKGFTATYITTESEIQAITEPLIEATREQSVPGAESRGFSFILLLNNITGIQKSIDAVITFCMHKIHIFFYY